MDTIPHALGPGAAPPSLFWNGRAGKESAAAVPVSNNPYRLGRTIGSVREHHLDPPLRFRIRPGGLRVRIAAAHPGAYPSALVPDKPWALLHGLARVGVRGASPGQWSATIAGADRL